MLLACIMLIYFYMFTILSPWRTWFSCLCCLKVFLRVQYRWNRVSLSYYISRELEHMLEEAGWSSQPIRKLKYGLRNVNKAELYECTENQYCGPTRSRKKKCMCNNHDNSIVIISIVISIMIMSIIFIINSSGRGKRMFLVGSVRGVPSQTVGCRVWYVPYFIQGLHIGAVTRVVQWRGWMYTGGTIRASCQVAWLVVSSTHCLQPKWY